MASGQIGGSSDQWSRGLADRVMAQRDAQDPSANETREMTRTEQIEAHLSAIVEASADAQGRATEALHRLIGAWPEEADKDARGGPQASHVLDRIKDRLDALEALNRRWHIIATKLQTI